MSDNKKKATGREERNKEGSAKMALNDAMQDTKYRSEQNELTKATSPDKNPDVLTNKAETRDVISKQSQNKRKLKGQENEDFGIE